MHPQLSPLPQCPLALKTLKSLSVYFALSCWRLVWTTCGPRCKRKDTHAE